MSLSTPVLDELAKALGVELPEELREACLRIEAAEQTVTTGDGTVTAVTPRHRPGQLSKAALRTRRWRARRRLAAEGGPLLDASPTGDTPSPSVTEASPKASPVTVRDVTGDGRDKKENPPHPLKKKPPPPSPQRGVSPTASPAAEPPRLLHRPNWRHERDPVFREISAIRGRSAPTDKQGGWEFATELIQQAETRLASRVTPLRVEWAADHPAQAPPPASASG